MKPWRHELAELRDLGMGNIKPLAIGTGPEVLVAGFEQELAIRINQSWQRVGYHEIFGGGWQGTEGVLWWQKTDLIKHSVQLSNAGQIPELFRERMAATLVEDKVIQDGPLAVRLVIRRSLAPGVPQLYWLVYPIAGQLDDLQMQVLVDRALVQARHDYLVE